MKMTKGVSKYIIALALLIFSFTGTVSMLSEIVITASAAMTAEQFISSGYDAEGVQLLAVNADIHVEGRLYKRGLILGNNGEHYTREAYVTFDVSGVNNLSFATCLLDNTVPMGGKLNIYADSELIREIELSNHPEFFISEIDVSEAKELKLELDKSASDILHETAVAVVDIGIDLNEGETVSDGQIPEIKSSTDLLKNIYNANAAQIVINTENNDEKINIYNTLYSEGVILGYKTDASFSFNVDSFKTISFSFINTNLDRSSVLKVYGDNEQISELRSEAIASPTKATLDVTNYRSLRIEGGSMGNDTIFVDFSFDDTPTSSIKSFPEYKTEKSIFDNIGYIAYAEISTGINADSAIEIEGTKYERSIRFLCDSEGKTLDRDSSIAILNVGSLDKLSFVLWSQTGAKVNIYADDKLYATASANTKPTAYLLDLKDCEILKIEALGRADMVQLAFKDADIPADAVVLENYSLLHLEGETDSNAALAEAGEGEESTSMPIKARFIVFSIIGVIIAAFLILLILAKIVRNKRTTANSYLKPSLPLVLLFTIIYYIFILQPINLAIDQQYASWISDGKAASVMLVISFVLSIITMYEAPPLIDLVIEYINKRRTIKLEKAEQARIEAEEKKRQKESLALQKEQLEQEIRNTREAIRAGRAREAIDLCISLCNNLKNGSVDSDSIAEQIYKGLDALLVSKEFRECNAKSKKDLINTIRGLKTTQLSKGLMLYYSGIGNIDATIEYGLKLLSSEDHKEAVPAISKALRKLKGAGDCKDQKRCEELAETLSNENDPYGSGLYAELLLRRCESEDIADQAIEIAKSAKVGKGAYFADDDEKDRFIQACNQKKDEILYKSKSPELKKYLKKHIGKEKNQQPLINPFNDPIGAFDGYDERLLLIAVDHFIVENPKFAVEIIAWLIRKKGKIELEPDFEKAAERCIRRDNALIYRLERHRLKLGYEDAWLKLAEMFISGKNGAIKSYKIAEECLNKYPGNDTSELGRLRDELGFDRELSKLKPHIQNLLSAADDNSNTYDTSVPDPLVDLSDYSEKTLLRAADSYISSKPEYSVEIYAWLIRKCGRYDLKEKLEAAARLCIEAEKANEYRLDRHSYYLGDEEAELRLAERYISENAFPNSYALADMLLKEYNGRDLETQRRLKRRLAVLKDFAELEAARKTDEADFDKNGMLSQTGELSKYGSELLVDYADYCVENNAAAKPLLIYLTVAKNGDTDYLLGNKTADSLRRLIGERSTYPAALSLLKLLAEKDTGFKKSYNASILLLLNETDKQLENGILARIADIGEENKENALKDYIAKTKKQLDSAEDYIMRRARFTLARLLCVPGHSGFDLKAAAKLLKAEGCIDGKERMISWTRQYVNEIKARLRDKTLDWDMYLKVYAGYAEDMKFLIKALDLGELSLFGDVIEIDRCLTEENNLRHKYLSFDPLDGYNTIYGYDPAEPELPVKFASAGAAYDAAVLLEQLGRVENSIFMYYKAARLGSRNAASAINNMSYQNTRYFVKKEVK